MNKQVIDLKSIPLSQEEAVKLEELIEKASEKMGVRLPPEKKESLYLLLTNTYKNYKQMEESVPAVTSADVQIQRKIALTSTIKAYFSNILDAIASVQPLDAPFGYVFYIDFQYADDHTAEGVSAGTSLASKRTSGYATYTENSPARRIKFVITNDTIDVAIRPLELSASLLAQLHLQSVFGKRQADDFIDQKAVNMVAQKLKDEMELRILQALDTAVDPANVVTFNLTSPDATDCVNERCHALRLVEKIDEASMNIYSKRGVAPNVVVVGNQALSVLRKGDVHITRYERNTPVPTGISRRILGELEDRYMLIYDPSVTDVLLFWRDPEVVEGSTVVYAPYVPLGSTPMLWERDLSQYKIVYTIDGYKVVHPELIAKVQIV